MHRLVGIFNRSNIILYTLQDTTTHLVRKLHAYVHSLDQGWKTSGPPTPFHPAHDPFKHASYI